MCDCTNGCCSDPEQAEAHHGLSRRDRLRNDPDYGDYLYEQARDRELERENDKEERPPAGHEILKVLFDTIPTVFAKEENRGWTGIAERGRSKQDDTE